MEMMDLDCESPVATVSSWAPDGRHDRRDSYKTSPPSPSQNPQPVHLVYEL